MAPAKSTSASKSTSTSGIKPGAKFGGLATPGDYVDGGGFGPSGDFVGGIIESGFQIERKIGKELRDDQNLGYFLALYLKFKVEELLDEKDTWDLDSTDGEFDLTLKLGPLSGFYPFSEWVPNKAGVYMPGAPAGILLTAADIKSGLTPFDILDALDKGFNGDRKTAGQNGSNFSLTEWKAGVNDELTGREANAVTRSRWYGMREGGKGHINAKSGFAQFEHESSAAILAAFPDKMIILEGKKGKDGKAGTDRAVFDLTAIGADGMPLGADYFLGMYGTFGYKSIGFTQRDGSAGTQKVLYVNRLEKWGEEVAQDGEGEDDTPKAGAKPAATTTKPTAKPAAVKPASAKPAAAAVVTSKVDEDPELVEDPAGLPEFEQSVVEAACTWLYKQPNHEMTAVVATKAIVVESFSEMADKKLAIAYLKTRVIPEGGVEGRIVYDAESETYSLTAEEVENQESKELEAE